MPAKDSSCRVKCFPLSFASNVAFAVVCAALFAAICLLLPPYFPLMEPDSGGYVIFLANRTAIYPIFLRVLTKSGLGLEQIVYVQLALFCCALAILVGSMLRWSIKRRWIVIFVVLLAANSYFSSFQRTILTESIGFSALAVATSLLLDYLRTGRAVFLAGAALFVGLTIGIRPAGLMIAPMIPIAALLKRKNRDVSAVVLALTAVAPILLGWASERVLYRLEHGDRSETILPYILTGKAAMLVRDDTTFVGPHAEALRKLGAKLNDEYAPAHEFLAGIPSWSAWPVLTAYYEAAAQFQVIDRDLAQLAAKENTTTDVLRRELGEQVIVSNPLGYLRLSLVHYLGQWSITALMFPPAARAVNSYRESVRSIPLYDVITATPFNPTPSWKSLLTYPSFMAAGLVTFFLSLLLPRYLIWPVDYDNPRHCDLMVASFFAVTCHLSMLLTSLTNVSTPRFLMMVYPHILLAGLFLMRSLRPDWISDKSGLVKNP